VDNISSLKKNLCFTYKGPMNKNLSTYGALKNEGNKMITKQQLNDVCKELETLEKDWKHNGKTNYMISHKLLGLLLQVFNTLPKTTKSASVNATPRPTSRLTKTSAVGKSG
jgi:hypothetical protein